MTEYKHGDKIELDIAGEKYCGHIEERMINQYPDKRTAMYVIVDSTKLPHFPISISAFEEYFGTISKLNQ